MQKKKYSMNQIVLPLFLFVVAGSHSLVMNMALAQSHVPSDAEFLQLKRQAENGDANSQLHMGILYFNGDYVNRDLPKAIQWYERAAGAGNVRAKYYLGRLLEFGIGVDENLGKAFSWYMKAVEENDAAAHLAIAGYHFAMRKKYMPYYFGTYNTWRIKAFLLVNRAKNIEVNETNFWDLYNDEHIYHQNDFILYDELKAKASRFTPSGQLNLALCYLHAIGTKTDKTKASMWVKNAAENGSCHAKFIIGAIDHKTDLLELSGERINSERYLVEAAECTDEPYFAYWFWSKYLFTQKKVNRDLLDKVTQMGNDGYLRAQIDLVRFYSISNPNGSEYQKWLNVASINGHMPSKYKWIVEKIKSSSAMDYAKVLTEITNIVRFPDFDSALALIDEVILADKESKDQFTIWLDNEKKCVDALSIKAIYQAVAALRDENHAESLRLLLVSANKGCGFSLHLMGKILSDSLPSEHAEAKKHFGRIIKEEVGDGPYGAQAQKVKWFLPAAKAGYFPAILKIMEYPWIWFFEYPMEVYKFTGHKYQKVLDKVSTPIFFQIGYDGLTHSSDWYQSTDMDFFGFVNLNRIFIRTLIQSIESDRKSTDMLSGYEKKHFELSIF